jgi:hypothetical protein
MSIWSVTVSCVSITLPRDGASSTAQTFPAAAGVHFSVVAMPGYREFEAGQAVSFRWERGTQDGYTFRAVNAWEGSGPEPSAVASTPSTAYSSSLTIAFDPPDGGSSDE